MAGLLNNTFIKHTYSPNHFEFGQSVLCDLFLHHDSTVNYYYNYLRVLQYHGYSPLQWHEVSEIDFAIYRSIDTKDPLQSLQYDLKSMIYIVEIELEPGKKMMSYNSTNVILNSFSKWRDLKTSYHVVEVIHEKYKQPLMQDHLQNHYIRKTCFPFVRDYKDGVLTEEGIPSVAVESQ